ncbi:MAG: RNA-binding domain-containing protein [Caldisphaera sp.]|uniref:RNA-binding domain-containing protein n=1 Tax=Caldisphaera sp. TaxID=2060322 RepID=UPI003D0AA6C4
MKNGRIIVEAELRPTEDEEKVIKAINNVFTYKDMEIIDQGEYKVIRCFSDSYDSLRKLHDLLRKQAILDAARSYFLKRVRGNVLQILLHKQALYQGKISLISWDEESPLGPIKITIESDNINAVIDWLSPQTVRGKPLWERDIPE